jgi:hypothetical protein
MRAASAIVPTPVSRAPAGVEKSLDTARMSACATSFDVIWHDYILTGPKSSTV